MSPEKPLRSHFPHQPWAVLLPQRFFGFVSCPCARRHGLAQREPSRRISLPCASTASPPSDVGKIPGPGSGNLVFAPALSEQDSSGQRGAETPTVEIVPILGFQSRVRQYLRGGPSPHCSTLFAWAGRASARGESFIVQFTFGSPRTPTACWSSFPVSPMLNVMFTSFKSIYA
ncbi:hypothetical protein BV898_17593 [Hypsibius exemplaris]|uniref:Uncharacterized protein n=1 Tax=Hypsibius exemplaris TaxID=2072580 RepID=A0A9X6NH52_HYPEX|nr:hypothetical protein BV898_17593 [Hypsibius exemplaris]